MADHAAPSTVETIVNNLTNEVEDGQDNKAPATVAETTTQTTPATDTDTDTTPYTPVFNKTVRTIVYVLGLVASCVGLGFMTFGDAAIGGYISTVAGFLASGLGVAYNPLRKH